MRPGLWPALDRAQVHLIIGLCHDIEMFGPYVSERGYCALVRMMVAESAFLDDPL